MLILYQLSSSLPTVALSHLLWVSKNPPGVGVIEPGSADAAQSPGSTAPAQKGKPLATV